MSDRSNRIVTAARLFGDGSAIDQLKDHHLILSQEGHGQVAPTVDYDGQTYIPETLDADLEHRLHLPAGPGDFGATEQLLEDLRGEVLRRCPGLDQDATLLAAIGIIGTWVVECLPGPLIINPWGPPGADTALLDLVDCLCRRPLCLVEPSLQALASLPVSTLILTHPVDRALRRLVTAVGEPNRCFVSGGELVHARCAIVAATYKPITLPAVTIHMTPAMGTIPRITTFDKQSLAERFPPRLLHYRLTQHLNVLNSQFDAPDFCPEVRLLARTLGAVVHGSADLQVRMTVALRRLDEQRRAERSQTTTAAVLEALLTLSHGKASAAYVGAICDLANSSLEDRDEPTKLFPKKVGDILRQELGLVARRRAPGYELELNVNTQRLVHRLAVSHDVLQRVPDCQLCQEMVAPMPSGNESA